MDTYVIFCGGIEACIYCIMAEEVRVVFTVLWWRELGKITILWWME